jgi:hypothetical protein
MLTSNACPPTTRGGKRIAYIAGILEGGSKNSSLIAGVRFQGKNRGGELARRKEIGNESQNEKEIELQEHQEKGEVIWYVPCGNESMERKGLKQGTVSRFRLSAAKNRRPPKTGKRPNSTLL